MTDKRIIQLACKFREAIDAARAEGKFDNISPFDEFPDNCCGETSYLLARFLIEYDIETLWISNDREGWTHAWLVVKDKRVTEPEGFDYPDYMQSTLQRYGMNNTHIGDNYSYEDVKNGLIIDITGDQFDDYDSPVFVGNMDEFHASFDFRGATDLSKEGYPYEKRIYSIIEKYL